MVSTGYGIGPAGGAACSSFFPQETKKSTAKKVLNIDLFLMCINWLGFIFFYFFEFYNGFVEQFFHLKDVPLILFGMGEVTHFLRTRRCFLTIRFHAFDDFLFKLENFDVIGQAFAEW